MSKEAEQPVFQFLPDTKFAAIHLTHCSCEQLPARLSLDERLFVTTSPVLALTEMERGRIGRDYAEAFDKSNMVIVAARVSETPGILDQESLNLEGLAYMLLYSIFMLGFPNFWPGVRGGAPRFRRRIAAGVFFRAAEWDFVAKRPPAGFDLLSDAAH